MVGRSTPYSDKHCSAASAHLFIDSGLMWPTRCGSIIFSNRPFRFHCMAHSAKFTCSLGRAGSMAGLAHNTSNSTTPKEYTSDLSVSCCLRKYSGSKYPKLPLTAVLTWASPIPTSFESPKSDIFAMKFSSSKILVDFTSRWMMAEAAPVWR
ncbi:hypothetical protein HanIR_Chr03g0119331 [Helianthus annuus]|nr:hypothetical protein HanIR_Chr03g0119331 [Helianthus annuus]